MESRITIVAYRPKPGKEAELARLAMEHHPRLLAESLVTERSPWVMIAADGTVIEIFEWKDEAAMQRAHTNPSVGKMWKEFGEVCDYVPLASIAESQRLFCDFSPL